MGSTHMNRFFITSFFVAASCAAMAQAVLMMPDSTNNRLVTFSAQDGSLINSNVFALAGGTQVHAMQVGNEIWVSEQIGDRVSRWSMTGTFLGAISGGLDNIRGMGLINGTVYVTNAGTANSAPGPALVTYDTNGNFLGNILTPTTSPSPFSVLSHQGGMLVGSSSANDDIHRYNLAGTSLGTFNNSSISFIEQMDTRANGEVVAACFTTGNISRFDPSTGALLGSFGTATGLRGVRELGNGNFIYSTGAGAFVYDVVSGGVTQVYTGGGRYFDTLNAVPEPATLALLGLSAVALIRRRKKA